MTCVECKANRSDQMKRIYYEHKEELEKAYQQGREEVFNEIKMLFKLTISEKPSRTVNEAEAEIILRNVERQIKEQKDA